MRDHSVVLAADLPSSQEVVLLAKQVGKIVDGIKVAEATLLQAGTEILRRIRDAIDDKPLLVDLKIADIGFLAQEVWQGTNSKIIRQLENSGATHVTVHGFPGPFSVAEAVSVARDFGLGVLLLPLMSHPSAGLFFSRPMSRYELVSEIALSRLDIAIPQDIPCKDVTEGILLLGEALAVDGYIGPATSPKDLQRYRTITSRPIWCPGFGRQDRLNRSLEEQFRQWAQILGPSSAAIVGSTIFGAADRAGAAKRVLEIRDRAVESVLA
ncbi:MAG: orotidine 5'-phosphate decarboxylase / HUMPS family protein [Desulfomonile sp.]